MDTIDIDDSEYFNKIDTMRERLLEKIKKSEKK